MTNPIMSLAFIRQLTINSFNHNVYMSALCAEKQIASMGYNDVCVVEKDRASLDLFDKQRAGCTL